MVLLSRSVDEFTSCCVSSCCWPRSIIPEICPHWCPRSCRSLVGSEAGSLSCTSSWESTDLCLSLHHEEALHVTVSGDHQVVSQQPSRFLSKRMQPLWCRLPLLAFPGVEELRQWSKELPVPSSALHRLVLWQGIYLYRLEPGICVPHMW